MRRNIKLTMEGCDEEVNNEAWSKFLMHLEAKVPSVSTPPPPAVAIAANPAAAAAPPDDPTGPVALAGPNAATVAPLAPDAPAPPNNA
ncbi:hypothetical protein ACP70R_004878 [Stipagrostis hirtigluma subsp. patula]